GLVVFWSDGLVVWWSGGLVVLKSVSLVFYLVCSLKSTVFFFNLRSLFFVLYSFVMDLPFG
ncbi:MAG: hypothetical protein JXK95_13340, partial [Bacteroidales bacterium]|nr:hypothetical protein [Bacteroidales bacterium]